MLTVSLTEKAILGAALATGAAVATVAALSPQSQLFGRTLIAGDNPNEVALTFDDGPNDACTLQLLEVLARHNAKAAFFMIGRYVRQRPDIVREVLAAGHILGNHTDSHPWLAWQGRRRICEELRRCNESLEDATGISVRYFRPPHGARRPYVLQQARAMGLTTVQWNVMGKDWKPIGPEAIVANVQKGIARAQTRGMGSNILLHDGSQFGMGAERGDTVRATRMLLESFSRSGMAVVPLSEWTEIV